MTGADFAIAAVTVLIIMMLGVFAFGDKFIKHHHPRN